MSTNERVYPPPFHSEQEIVLRTESLPLLSSFLPEELIVNKRLLSSQYCHVTDCCRDAQPQGPEILKVWSGQ